ncbi:MAG: hypothetical protein GEU90_10765 [Gemmatimonas sp.]|nr:hypothetical protein [Gemmatimonas sp.]
MRADESESWRADSRPLVGKRIVVTRPRAQAGELAAILEGLGADVLLAPMIRIADPVDPQPLRKAAREPDRFDWIVFTSVNGVVRFWEALRASGLDTRSLAGVSLCAIGPATASAIELEGARADLLPHKHVAEGVAEALAEEMDLAGSRILLPQAEAARDVLAAPLREAGAEVVEVTAYRTVPDREGAAGLSDRLDAGEIDLITFTSSSTVQSFIESVGREIGRAEVATIGPVTAATARSGGLPVAVEANPHTVIGMVEGILSHYASRDYGA